MAGHPTRSDLIVFDLEAAISAWRRPLRSIGTLSNDDIRELEAHLRDDIESRLESGLPVETAFRESVRGLDDLYVIEREYRKVARINLRRKDQLRTELLYTGSMIRNFFVVAIRNIARQKGLAFINVFGLSLGIGVCLLLFLFVRKETSFDRFHEKADRIVRVVGSRESGASAYSAPDLGPVLAAALPGVEHAVRFRKVDDQVVGSDPEQSPETRFTENDILYADSAFFNVFSFDLLRGNSRSALVEPHSIVLTESMAIKYFGDADPVGQQFFVGDEPAFTVVGVVQNPPDASSIEFNFLASFSTLQLHKSESAMLNSGWGVSAYPTYLLLREGVDIDNVASAVEGVVASQTDMPHIAATEFSLEPLVQHHFSNLSGSLGPVGDRRYLTIFGTIAILILVVACINYVNLATATAARRAREVGIRKVAGAKRSLLTWQFLAESIITSVLAVVVGVLLVAIALPYFNSIVDSTVTFERIFSADTMGAVAVLVLITGILAGLYPAVFLSSFAPARVLKGDPVRGSGMLLRKGLVVVQFAISVFLLVGAIVVQQQLAYIDTKDLGLSKERVIALRLKGSAVENASIVAHNIGALPVVNASSVAGGLPGLGSIRFGAQFDGEQRYATLFAADPDFIETLDMKLTSGRGFSDEFDDSSGRTKTGGAIINETLARTFGIDDPIGADLPFTPNGNTYRIVGVVSDFHFRSLNERIEPAIIAPIADYWNSYVIAKLNSTDYDAAIDAMSATWSANVPDAPFDYFFLDEAFDAFYRGPHRLAQVFGAFSTIAIVIACLGLFGLATYTAHQRVREIGIRKVLGASVSGVVALLTSDFLKLIAVSFVVAAPLAWIAMNSWLDSFAYRVSIGAVTYLIAAAMTALFATATVGYQALRAATRNPVGSLKHE